MGLYGCIHGAGSRILPTPVRILVTSSCLNPLVFLLFGTRQTVPGGFDNWYYHT